MKYFKSITTLLALLTLFACSTSGKLHQESRGQTNPPSTTQVSSSDTFANVSWESKPRSLGRGTGGQLWMWASEAINMIQAVPKDKGMDLIYRSSHNEGQSFGRVIPINTVAGEVSAHGENNPQLRMGPGIGIYTAWQGSGDIKFARSMSFGHSFLPPVKVNDDEGKAHHSFFTMEAAPQGDIYIAWIDGRDKATEPPGQQSIYLARSTDQGATFSKNIKVAGNICPCCRPSLAIGKDGTLYMSWRHVAKGDRRVVVVASSKDHGQSWSQPVEVHSKGWVINGCAHSGPAIGITGDRLTVVWYTASDAKPRMLMSQSRDGGKTFGEVQEIQGEVYDANHPHMTVVDGEAWVMFQGRDPKTDDGWGPSKPWVLRVNTDGSFTKPEALPGNNVSYPQLFAGTGGRLYAVWTQFGDQGPEVMLCRGRIGT